MDKIIPVAILITTILVSCFFVNSILDPPPITSAPSATKPARQSGAPGAQRKAAIVDQLSLTLPSQTFVDTATNVLVQAGYAVDYYSGEQITVGFYRALPTRGYTLIILRAHSALKPISRANTRATPSALHFGSEDPSALLFFSSEDYDAFRYPQEILEDELVPVTCSLPSGAKSQRTYFAISAKFVRQCMEGEFKNTTFIMTGCNGLAYTDMAGALTEKGVSTYIAWTGRVTADTTDKATIYLLNHLILEKQTIGQAIENTMTEAGPNPYPGSTIGYYPPEKGGQTAENTK